MGLYAKYQFSDIIHQSPVMEHVIQRARKFASVTSNVLVYGETGTGKELVAQSIHNASKRKNGPFVAINCASFPENLLESELFGYCLLYTSRMRPASAAESSLLSGAKTK